MRIKSGVAWAIICLFIFSSCGQVLDKAYDVILDGIYQDSFPLISSKALHKKLTENEELILLDTRTTKEFNVSHLRGARYVGYDDFEIGKLQNVPRDAQVVVYCSVGYRSTKVGEKLKQAGFTNVYNLYGGIFEWVNEGFAVYDTIGETNKVHAYSKTWGIWLRKGDKVYE